MTDRDPVQSTRRLYELVTVRADEIREGDMYSQNSPELSCFSLVVHVRAVDGGYIEIEDIDTDRFLLEPADARQILRYVEPYGG
jgi:hypothetical protein